MKLRSSRMLRELRAGQCLKLIAFTILAGALAGDSLAAEPAQPTVISRYVAIDNVCAWPNLTVLRDGTIIAMIFNRPNHGLEAGDIDCWASTDSGRTWQKRGTPGPHEPETNRIHVAAGLAGNGDLIVITGGWSNRYPSESTPAWANSKSPDGSRMPFRFELVQNWVARSSDGGFTWSIDKRVFPARGPNGVACTPFGNIQTAADGSLCLAVYNRPMPALRAFVYRSRDDGKTWGEPVAMDEKTSRNETALLHLGDGQWLAAVRSYGPHGIYLYRSTDDARSWQQPAPLTATAQYPAHLLKLRDGRLLLSYGNRVADQFGVLAKTSTDNGKTWSNPIAVVSDLTSGDCGYPASVQLPGGEILTAYYAARVASHQRYHMGTVIWKLPAK